MEDATLRGILARNLGLLIDAATPNGARRSVRAWALGRGLDVRLIDRLLKGQHAVTLDKLDEIAEACGVKPWHLLLDNFQPGEPADAPMTDAERAMLRRLRALLDS